MGNRIHNHYIQPHFPHIQKQQTKKQTGEYSFQSLLNKQLSNELTLTKHAKKRLDERNIHIDDSKWPTLQERLSEASKKGIKESLVLMDNAALVVNAQKNTVITAMDRKDAGTQIFTNINGAIIID